MHGELHGRLESLILAAIDESPAHGYAIVQRIEALSGGRLSVPEGSLYPALQRLERQQVVASAWSTEQGRRRRVYSLTTTGRTALAEARTGWQAFAAAVDNVLGVAR